MLLRQDGQPVTKYGNKSEIERRVMNCTYCEKTGSNGYKKAMQETDGTITSEDGASLRGTSICACFLLVVS